jgi:hypothetical protein
MIGSDRTKAFGSPRREKRSVTGANKDHYSLAKVRLCRFPLRRTFDTIQQSNIPAWCTPVHFCEDSTWQRDKAALEISVGDGDRRKRRGRRYISVGDGDRIISVGDEDRIISVGTEIDKRRGRR